MTWTITIAASIVAAVLAWLVAKRRPEHRPVALLISLSLFADVVRRALELYVIVPARTASLGAPLTGWPRAAGHLDAALFVAWPASLAAVALLVFSRRRPWPVLAAWVLLVVVLVAGYPAIRGDVLRRAYLGAQLAALAVAVGAGVTWAWRREAFGLTRGAVALIVGVELLLLFGAWRGNVFTTWDIVQGSYTTLYAGIAVLQGVSLWASSKGSTSR